MRRKLNEIYREAAEDFAGRLVAELGPEVDAIVLYGSVARGEATRDSDVDVLVIARDAGRAREHVKELAWAVEAERERAFWLCPVVLGREEFLRLARVHWPFVREVSREGIALYDDGTFWRENSLSCVGSEQGRMISRQYVKTQLELADEALSDARYNLADGRLRSATNRAYYGMLHAVHAALEAAGARRPRTHSGAHETFSRYYVGTGRVERQLTVDLEQVFQSRLVSDYEASAGLGEEGVEAAVEKAAAFVERVREVLGYPRDAHLGGAV